VSCFAMFIRRVFGPWVVHELHRLSRAPKTLLFASQGPARMHGWPPRREGSVTWRSSWGATLPHGVDHDLWQWTERILGHTQLIDRSFAHKDGAARSECRGRPRAGAFPTGQATPADVEIHNNLVQETCGRSHSTRAGLSRSNVNQIALRPISIARRRPSDYAQRAMARDLWASDVGGGQTSGAIRRSRSTEFEPTGPSRSRHL